MTLERLDSFVPVEIVPLPRPLHRFGTAFPQALAEAYANAYTAEHAVVLDPLAHPFSAADAAQRSERSGIARSPQAIGAWARGVVAAAPSLAQVTAALEAVGDSTLTGAPHRVTMRDLYASHCATCRGPVVVEAFLWERDAPAPTKKAFRCAICAREGRALLIEPTAEEDDARARKVEGDGLAYWQFVERFGAAEERRVLAQSIAALYTPRNLAALMGTLRAIETALPDGAVKAFLRLCLLEVIVSGSRLNAVAGHGAPLRLIDPSRYGYKSAKQIVAITFVAEGKGSMACDVFPYYSPSGEIQTGYDHPLDIGPTARRRITGGEITDY